MLRAALWRRAGSLAVLAAAAVAFAASCLGPLWATASEDAVGSAAVARASADERSVAVSAAGNQGLQVESLIPALAVRAAQTAAALPPAADRALPVARTSLASASRQQVRAGEWEALAPLVWQDGGCESLRLVAGRCPRAQDQVALSSRSAVLLRVSPGGVVELPQLAGEPEVAGRGTPFPTRYRVVGVYLPGDAEDVQWAGTGWFSFTARPSTDVRDALPPVLDAVLTTRDLLDVLAVTPVVAQVQRTLDASARSALDRARLEAELRDWEVRTTTESDLLVRTPVLRLLTELREDGSTTRRTAVLLGLQLLLLACWGLSSVVSSSVSARTADTALGGLRGLRRRTTIALGLAEPLLLVLVALPLGLLLGTGVTAALASVALPGDVALRADGVLGWSVAAAAAGAALAVALGVRRALVAPVLQQLGGGAVHAGTGPWALVGEAVVVALAVAAVVELARGDGAGDGTGLLAPALTGIALGVLLARVLRVALLLAVRWTRDRGSPSAFLAVRGGARRGGTTVLVALLAVTVSVAVYAAGVLAVGDTQRAAQAEMETGAAAVYEVAPLPVSRLLAAVDEVDPGGSRLAAAARRDSTRGAGFERVVAVDAERLAAVAAWRPEWASTGVGALAGALRPPTEPPLVVSGERLELTVLTEPDSDSTRGELVLRLRTAIGADVSVRLGEVEDRSEPQVLAVDLPDCTGGCAVTSIGVLALPSDFQRSLVGTVTWQRLVVDGEEVPGAFDDEDAWRAVLPVPADTSPFAVPTTRLEGRRSGLEVRYAELPDRDVVIARADVPAHVPVLAAGGTELRPVGQDDLVYSLGLDAEPTTARVVGRAAVLPWLGTDGSLADLATLDRASAGVDDSAVLEVWSSAPVSERTAEALRVAGLEVVATRSAASRTTALQEAGSARVLLLLPALAAAAVVVAGFAMAAQALSAARTRAVESAALAAVGVAPGVSRRAGLLEALGAVATAAVAGGAAALLSLDLTAGDVVRAGLRAPLAPLPDRVPTLALLSAGTLVVLALVVLAAVCAGIGVRRGRPEDTRQAA